MVMDNEFDLFDYLEKNESYKNAQGVEFRLIANDCIYLDCPFPGVKEHCEYMRCKLCGKFRSESVFQRYFPVGSPEDLEQLIPSKLYADYLRGNKIEVDCLLDMAYLGGNLNFAVIEGTLVACQEFTGEKFLVKEKLETPNDFYAYTVRYCVKTYHRERELELANAIWSTR